MTGEHADGQPRIQADLLERVHYWMDYFENAGEEDCAQYSNRALEELNTLWHEAGLMGIYCVVNGRGTWSELTYEQKTEEDDDGDVIDVSPPKPIVSIGNGDIENKLGRSWGFHFGPANFGEIPRLWYVFEVSTVAEYLHPTFDRQSFFKMFVEPRSCLILSMDEVEQSFRPEDLSQADASSELDVLNKLSDEFSQLIRSTAFRRQPHKRQIAKVDSMIRRAERSAGLYQKEVVLEPSYGYLSRPALTGMIEYEPIGVAGLTLSGLCMGVTMVGRELLTQKAIRRDADLITPGSKHDGLCLSVALDNTDELPPESRLTEGTVLHIPISGQTMDVIFDPSNKIRDIL